MADLSETCKEEGRICVKEFHLIGTLCKSETPILISKCPYDLTHNLTAYHSKNFAEVE